MTAKKWVLANIGDDSVVYVMFVFVHLQEEANNVLADGRRNAQRVAELQRIDRDIINRGLNSRASAVPPATRF